MVHTESIYVKRAYRRIIALALLCHSSYILIFALLGVLPLTIYNVVSVLFYCFTLFAVYHGHFRLAVSTIHIEVCLFVIFCVLVVGGKTGAPLYLMAVSSLVYFCPYEHKYVPYLFSALEIFVFLVLLLYCTLAPSVPVELSRGAMLAIFLYNSCASFAIILYGAFIARVSASVSQRQLQDENRSLSVMANYDQLTGLLSRYAFLDRFDQYGVVRTALAMGDIDDFKQINDSFGHPCGDYILSQTAELMRRHLGRNVDICRWGGEEFVFLFRDTTLQAAVEALEALRGTIDAASFSYGGIDIHITMTFGLCPAPQAIDAQTLVEQADAQMYLGKAGGKNRVKAKYEE